MKVKRRLKKKARELDSRIDFDYSYLEPPVNEDNLETEPVNSSEN